MFFMIKEKGDLYFLPNNKKMNVNLYLQVLEDHMLNFYKIHGSEVFMHDSAPCHKTRKVTRYLESKQINILEWPGNSPDLNPIENCWHKIKKYVRKQTKTLEHWKKSWKKCGTRRWQWNISEIWVTHAQAFANGNET